MNGSNKRLKSNLSVNALFIKYLKHWVLAIFTLGFSRFYTLTRIRQYIWQGVSFDGDAFEYTGTAMELFVAFLKSVGLMLVGYVVFFMGMFFFMFVFGEMAALFLALPIAVLMLLFIPMVIFGALRYRAGRTTLRGIRFRMKGSALHFGWMSLGNTILSMMTLGICAPNARQRTYAYIISNLYFGDKPFAYQPSLLPKWTRYAYLLAVPTLGISLVYYQAALMRSFTQGTALDGLRFRANMKGSSLLGLWLVDMALLAISFGLLRPVIFIRDLRFFLEHTEVLGELDYSSIHQAQKSSVGMAEGLADSFEVELA